MGGAERIMIGIAESLVEGGYDVDLVLAERRGELLQQVPTAVRIVELESASRATVLAALPGFPWSSILDLGRLAIRNRLILKLPSFATYLREEAPCVLLVTVLKNSLLALWARHLAGVDLRLVVREANVHSLQHAGRSRDNPILNRLARKWYPHADTFVAISQGVATDLTHSLGIPAGRISTIHNPVDADNVARLASTPIDHPWLRADIPLLLSVGRLAQQKDHATLLRAFAIVWREREVRLLVLGEGSCRRELEKLSCELGVERDVSFPGITSNPYPFMASASCFVLSSAWEGFGNVLIEALACGCPVVSTDCQSGSAEILDGGRFGRLARTGDPVDLARAIVETLDEPIDRERLLARARNFPPVPTYQRYREIILTNCHAADQEGRGFPARRPRQARSL
jgi:glycosyltransferase involved in cell wall biosynthesis